MYYVVMSEEPEDTQESVVIRRIKAMMKVRKRSAADISRIGGIQTPTLSNILASKRENFAAESLRQIAKGLDVTADYLLGISEEPNPSDAPPYPDFAIEVLEHMRELNQTRNYELLVIARAFIQSNYEIWQQTKHEILDLIMDAGDEMNPDEVDAVIKALELMERKSLPPVILDVPPSPDEPGEQETQMSILTFW